MFLKASRESLCKGFTPLGSDSAESSTDETLAPRDSAIQGPGGDLREALPVFTRRRGQRSSWPHREEQARLAASHKGTGRTRPTAVMRATSATLVGPEYRYEYISDMRC